MTDAGTVRGVLGKGPLEDFVGAGAAADSAAGTVDCLAGERDVPAEELPADCVWVIPIVGCAADPDCTARGVCGEELLEDLIVALAEAVAAADTMGCLTHDCGAAVATEGNVVVEPEAVACLTADCPTLEICTGAAAVACTVDEEADCLAGDCVARGMPDEEPLVTAAAGCEVEPEDDACIPRGVPDDGSLEDFIGAGAVASIVDEAGICLAGDGAARGMPEDEPLPTATVGCEVEADTAGGLTVDCTALGVPDEGLLEALTGAGAAAGIADETVGCLAGDRGATSEEVPAEEPAGGLSCAAAPDGGASALEEADCVTVDCPVRGVLGEGSLEDLTCTGTAADTAVGGCVFDDCTAGGIRDDDCAGVTDDLAGE